MNRIIPVGEIQTAVERYKERKLAAIGGGDTIDNGRVEGKDAMRRALAGLDIDLEELHEFRVAAAQAAITGMERTMEDGLDSMEALAHAMAGMWVDGLVTGMLLEDGRDGA